MVSTRHTTETVTETYPGRAVRAMWPCACL